MANFPTSEKETIIVAHRGASRDAPENTIPAFQLAWKQGADAVEGDFHLTEDGQIVCIHDSDTKRVADRSLIIKQSSLKALQKLDVGAHFGGRFRGTMIPTIVEVLATIPQKKKIYVEIKSDESIIPVLLKEIKDSGLEAEQVIVVSFKTEVISAVKTEAPEHKAFWLSGLKKEKRERISPSIEEVLKILEHTGADGFSSSATDISEGFIRCIMENGYEYHVWTVDNLEMARRFQKWGAMSITTNIPGYIKANL